MKPTQHSLILILCLLVSLVPAQAQYEDKLKSLRHNIGQADSASSSSESRLSKTREELSALQQVESFVAKDDFSNAIRIVKRALARSENEANQKL
ncbi:MAG: hypothetical protein HC904_02935 [Blastochloris sp.]|nr:hypothetical protein [Blastochloris sp.]